MAATVYGRSQAVDWINVVTQYGADPAGVADSTNAINSAIAAIPSTGGVVYLPSGTYKVSSTLTVTSLYACIKGDGRWATTLKFTGTGDCLRIYNTDTTGKVTGGGVLDLAIDGTSAGAGSTGLHYGDMRAGELRLGVWNFSGAGSIGVRFDNQYSWTEETHGYLWLENCTQHVVFDVSGAVTSTNSFGYTDMAVELLAKVGQDGIVLQNGAFLYNSRFTVKANFQGSASAQSNAVLRITGQIPAGHPGAGAYSALKFCRLDVLAETNSSLGSNQPATVAFGSATNNVIAGCSGVMDFSVGSAFASAVNSAGSFQFDGPVFGATQLFRTQGGTPQFNAGTGLSNGGNISTVNDVITVQPTSNLTGMIMPKWGSAMGAPTKVTVINRASSFTITMAAAGTSNVANGTDCVIRPDTSVTFWWDTFLAQWVPAQTPQPGRFLCAPQVYAPGTQTTVPVSSTTFAAFSSGSICTGPFVAPASGQVVVELSCAYQISSGGQKLSFALAALGTVSPIVGQEVTVLYTTGSSLTYGTFRFMVTGLTQGTSYQFDLLGAVASGTLSILAIGVSGTTQGSAGAPVIMTVQAV